MAELKTKPTKTTIAGYLADIPDEDRRKDCKALVKLMTRVTGEKPVMWGTSIVGFGKYHYKYASGHEGDTCIAGFASRKTDLTLYNMGGGFAGHEALMKKLGKHKSGKGCLYIKRLADIDLDVLETLIQKSVARSRARVDKAAR